MSRQFSTITQYRRYLVFTYFVLRRTLYYGIIVCEKGGETSDQVTDQAIRRKDVDVGTALCTLAHNLEAPKRVSVRGIVGGVG